MRTDGWVVVPARNSLGFHIPPFFSVSPCPLAASLPLQPGRSRLPAPTQVNHLHLHLLSLPLPFPGSLKYRPSVPSRLAVSLPSAGKGVKLKGFSWFVEVEQVIRILEAGQRVKVGSVRVGSTREGQSQRV
ncbi:SPOSA6832_04128 [Sporobolomyces salmonicolor]|uniref:SPOSA6832_04128-mRNA-1:cds n=1 Tax=Sporidiobolus salmonicolor TaxID=5005 RepID=A0A0D6EQT0_SPOSA|nr:SPOSA6832_04128 [Sporobolomyces salmonicolor]